MAWLERDPSGNYHVAFRFGRQKFRRSLRTRKKSHAEARCTRLEETITLVESGRLAVPHDLSDVGAFLLSDGKVNGKPKPRIRLGLSGLFEAYWKSLPEGSHEPETTRIARIHTRHFERILGARLNVESVTQTTLQEYVNKRAQQKGKHGRKISATTIRKETSTFRMIWRWAKRAGHVSTDFPDGIRYPKTDEKPRFQTWDDIERQIDRGHLGNVEKAQLWDCLFLRIAELEDVLRTIEGTARYSFLHPMVVMAVHTGARRSELCRSQDSDFDFEARLVTIREKKRCRGRRTTRQVPISTTLARAMRSWLQAKRDSLYAFPAEHKVSRKRKLREHTDAVSVYEASEQFETTLSGTKWCKLRGWHVFRHSFASNCASEGVDQRLIDEWMGHQTEEMRRRYRHLFPCSQRTAIDSVFGRD